MTPEERAEKIQKHCLAHGGICSGPEVLAVIAFQLREAEEEASECRIMNVAAEIDLAYIRGRASMREEAAKVAEVNDGRTPGSEADLEACSIVAAIRAIAVEGK